MPEVAQERDLYTRLMDMKVVPERPTTLRRALVTTRSCCAGLTSGHVTGV
jgi:hypothetical protein